MSKEIQKCPICKKSIIGQMEYSNKCKYKEDDESIHLACFLEAISDDIEKLEKIIKEK